jgi:D-sedoheptulose 7-phosphate isomerase
MIDPDHAATRAHELQRVLEILPARLFDDLQAAAAAACASLQKRGGIYFVGNGGSAAEAEHLAAELVGRFELDRAPMRGGTLTASGVVLTALANDYPADELFARQVRGLLDEHDTLVALSTSGRSRNVLRALEEAKRIGCTRIGFTGIWPTEFAARCDWVLAVPSASVPRIQEVHLMLGHVFCEIVENCASTASARRGSSTAA